MEQKIIKSLNATFFHFPSYSFHTAHNEKITTWPCILNTVKQIFFFARYSSLFETTVNYLNRMPCLLIFFSYRLTTGGYLAYNSDCTTEVYFVCKILNNLQQINKGIQSKTEEKTLSCSESWNILYDICEELFSK